MRERDKEIDNERKREKVRERLIFKMIAL